MKLNPDCVRDILFVVEEYSTYSNDVSEDKLYEKPYSKIFTRGNPLPCSTM